MTNVAAAKKSPTGKLSNTNRPRNPPAIPANAANSSSTCWLRIPRRSDAHAIFLMNQPVTNIVFNASASSSHGINGISTSSSH